jgi:hypothetical protein
VRRWIKSKTSVRLLVHTAAGDSIEGILAIEARDGLVLVDAALRTPEGRVLELAGETFVPRDAVRLVQTLPPKAAPASATHVA